MDNKKLITMGIAWLVIQTIISCGIFVTFPQMASYAVSKDSFSIIEKQLQRIEEKVDMILGSNL